MARLKKTPSGWTVVHSTSGRRLRGPFKSKASAKKVARKICRRNMGRSARCEL